MDEYAPAPGFPPAEPESLSQLRGDCARMAPHWRAGTRPAGPRPAPAGSPRPRGVRVPARSAHLLDGMSEYGD
ncbi:hypothetical protein [Streptomyces sp. JJ36]|uniref:hypothetical protein n=1 Tax=Streptomyces sp. JJ36 TaxID=2736645 RepID=UPI001F410638|nr:hypothetical protein [Streptomyces sp. JJ36]MCF6522956.1 hypothetical protein [Streptomyces sp. JJ36]